MRILYVMPSVRHPQVRGELRHYHFLLRLARRHEITLLVLNRDDVPATVLDELRRSTRHLLQVGPPVPVRPASHGLAGIIAVLRWRVRKLRLVRRGMTEMTQVVERLVAAGGFDLALLSGTGIHPIAERLSATPMVVDWCDTDSARLRRGLRHSSPLQLPWHVLQYWQVRRIEQKLLHKLPHVTFISRRDRDAAAPAAQSATIIPNGCDLTYWRRRSAERTDRIVFTGVLDYRPNADAAKYLLSTIAPLVREEIPHIEVVIAGRNPPRDVLTLARRSQGVTVTGSVPDLRPYLENAAVFVAPLRFASGMQNKVLEAMAMELPVVTTPIVADGLKGDQHDSPPLLVAETAREIASHIAAIVQDPSTARRLGAEGRRYVQRHCDWERSARMLDRLCRQVAVKPRATESLDHHGDSCYRPIHSTRSKDRVSHWLA
jgi:glycosyltransferase involved in cell wall biosynthesis